MCTASASSERLPVQRPTAASTTRKPAVRPNTATSRCLWREPWVCRCTEPPSAGGGQDELRLSLSDALAREEAGVRLERVAELAEGAVELGRARVHLEDREDAAVALDERDVEGGGHVLHVELGEDLLAEVEEDQVALDLVRGRALEAARLTLSRVGQLHAQGQRARARLDRHHPHRHAREGGAPARTLGTLGRVRGGLALRA